MGEKPVVSSDARRRLMVPEDQMRGRVNGHLADGPRDGVPPA